MSHRCRRSSSWLYLSWKCIIPRNMLRTWNWPTELQSCLSKAPTSNLLRLSPEGCLSFSMKLFSLVMNLAATTYLLVPELSSSVFSSRYSNSPLRSTNDVLGTILLVCLSWNMYVTAPHEDYSERPHRG